MVAYSFKRQFVNPIRRGLGIPEIAPAGSGIVIANGHDFSDPKRQTIRADRKRHARPGEELQLYCGMRTKGCFLIGKARCVSTLKIVLQLGLGIVSIEDYPAIRDDGDLDAFAQQDGFANWGHMREFWSREHPDVRDFEGVIIKWEPIT